MSEPIIHEINLDAVPRPQENQIARVGPRRLVKLAPVLGGVPILWRSPNPIESHDAEGKKQAVYQTIVLVQKGPKPQTMAVEIPVDLYDKLHDVPVEW